MGPPVSLGQHFAGAPMPNSLMNKPADVADSNQIPDLPDLGGPIPKPWGVLIDHLGEVEPGSSKRHELEARLQVWLLFSDMRARQLEVQAARQQAAALNRATWVLALATMALILATIFASIIGG